MKPRSRIGLLGGQILALAAIAGVAMPGSGRNVAADTRHDPERPKTDADLERLAAALRKRERRARK